MPYFQRMPVVFAACFWLVFLPVFHSSAEELYHWKDQNGVSCFSNVSPPDGVRRFSAMTLAPSPPTGAETFDMDKNVASEVSGIRVSENNAPAAGRSALKERIQSRKVSIGTIEALLRTRPNDTGLRKQLCRKKQAQYEDAIQLKLLNN